MSDIDIQLSGRLSALEFVLEVILANELAYMPQADSAAFKADMLSKDAYIKHGPIDADILQKVSQSLAENLEIFLDKVAKREADIRSNIS